MISFANPHLLYLLILVPVSGLLYALACLRRKRDLEKFGRLSVLRSLMPDVSKYMGWVKTILALCALSFIIIALARPYTPASGGKTEEEKTTRGIEVMLCVDVSNSMLASSTDDPKGVSRLQRAKFLLERLINKMNDDKVGLIVFAGDAYTQLPITSDYISAKMFLNGITTDMVPTQGTAIGAALDMAINSFTPDSEFQKAIVLITDGENFEDNATEVAKRAANAGIEVDVIGIGSGKGAPIPVKQGADEYMKDFNGNEVKTALNEKMAQDIASAGDGIYVSGSSSAAVDDIDSQLNKLAKTEYKRSAAVSSANELFPIAALIALIFLVIDGFLSYSKLSWLRDINFFSKNVSNEKR